VSNVIIDGMILTDRLANYAPDKSILEDQDRRLSPESIANVSCSILWVDKSIDGCLIELHVPRKPGSLRLDV
jgi:hypothetical protein